MLSISVISNIKNWTDKKSWHCETNIVLYSLGKKTIDMATGVDKVL